MFFWIVWLIKKKRTWSCIYSIRIYFLSNLEFFRNQSLDSNFIKASKHQPRPWVSFQKKGATLRFFGLIQVLRDGLQRPIRGPVDSGFASQPVPEVWTSCWWFRNPCGHQGWWYHPIIHKMVLYIPNGGWPWNFWTINSSPPEKVTVPQ